MNQFILLSINKSSKIEVFWGGSIIDFVFDFRFIKGTGRGFCSRELNIPVSST